MSTLEEIEGQTLFSYWLKLVKKSQLERLTWIFCPGHAEVNQHERADKARISADNLLTFDPSIILAMVLQQLADTDNRVNLLSSSLYMLQRLRVKNIAFVNGPISTLQGSQWHSCVILSVWACSGEVWQGELSRYGNAWTTVRLTSKTSSKLSVCGVSFSQWLKYSGYLLQKTTQMIARARLILSHKQASSHHGLVCFFSSCTFIVLFFFTNFWFFN